MRIPEIFLAILIFTAVHPGLAGQNGVKSFDRIVLEDDFSGYSPGLLSPPVGPHTEYHFLKEVQPRGNWRVTSFYHNPRGADTAWRVETSQGKHAMCQTITNKNVFTHPMVMAGDHRWRDYRASVEMVPEIVNSRAGLVFRYRNDRQYYFFGMVKSGISLLSVNHESAFHTPVETALGNKKFDWQSGRRYLLSVEVSGSHIKAYIDSNPVFEVSDATFLNGQIALMADNPASFQAVTVKSSESEIERIARENLEFQQTEKRLQDANPGLVLWKKIKTEGFGVGRNLRFGDLNDDGKIDVLIGQVVHHAFPRDSYSELSCLTAMTFDGEILWQKGKPSTDHESLTNDVAFQIYDIDNDGSSEVIYTMDCELIVADGATGKTKFKRSTPELKGIQIEGDNKNKIVREWTNILGDCIFFCDLRGKGRATDLVIKDRYTTFWVLDEKLNTQWSASCRTGHYPFAKDIDNDGKEELFMGYSAFNSKGQKLWSLDDQLKDHCDGIGVVNFGEKQGSADRIFIAASDQGAVVTDTKGNISEIKYIGHVQNPAVANFRSDLPGLETVSINFWGNQGIIHFFDSNQRIYFDFEPTQYGSMCLPINWTGGDEEFFVLNANILEGGMYDGWGRKVVTFPDDGHPDMCNAVLDLTGDLRDEIVVWDPGEIWVYTQSDSPKKGDLHKTRRNPLFNYSNYQLTVSLPETK